jgi:hypothetical protein
MSGLIYFFCVSVMREERLRENTRSMTHDEQVQSTCIASYSTVPPMQALYTLVKRYHSCWVHPEAPEFDPLGVVDHLKSARHQSLAGVYVVFRL